MLPHKSFINSGVAAAPIETIIQSLQPSGTEPHTMQIKPLHTILHSKFHAPPFNAPHIVETARQRGLLQHNRCAYVFLLFAGPALIYAERQFLGQFNAIEDV